MTGSKIKSIKSLGKKKTYNLTMESDQHNYAVKDLNSDQFVISANSHSCCYAYISYTTAYMKANFPDEFMCAYLNVETIRSKWEKVDTLWNEAKRMGIEIMPRKVGYCKLDYTIISKADSSSGVARTKVSPSILCKGLSHRAAEDIVSHQPYKDLKDFATRTGTKEVDLKAVEALVEGKFFPSAKKGEVMNKFRAVRNDRKKNDRKGFQMGGDVFD